MCLPHSSFINLSKYNKMTLVTKGGTKSKTMCFGYHLQNLNYNLQNQEIKEAQEISMNYVDVNVLIQNEF